MGPVFKAHLVKPDGRALWLYARQPFDAGTFAPSPSEQRVTGNSHLRWHALRGEWIAYASHRQHRTFLPPPEWNPLAVTVDPAAPTELPPGPWEVAVFENMFPTLSAAPGEPPEAIVETRPGVGSCEVVVFTQDPNASLGRLSLDRLALIVDVWADRYVQLGARDDVAYVFPFENRGVEVGVTLHHPHGQIYGYPFVPPVALRELSQQRDFLERHKRGLIEDLLARELADAARRVLYQGEHVVALVPVCARYPYEVWIAPRHAAPSLEALTSAERRDFARALKTVLLKYDGLWQKPFPYIMAFHQAPTDGQPHPESHVHVEFYPAYRMPNRLKYLAGSESGAGVFTADTLPEDAAAQLRAVEVPDV
jgi:UDPglucose--hexose-1-phosphate uridylyltransferase